MASSEHDLTPAEREGEIAAWRAWRDQVLSDDLSELQQSTPREAFAAGYRAALGSRQAEETVTVEQHARAEQRVQELIEGVERGLADRMRVAGEHANAVARAEAAEQEVERLRGAANGALDHYFHRRATSLLQDRTLEAAMQRLARALANQESPGELRIEVGQGDGDG